MKATVSQRRACLISALLGAVGGGIFVSIVTKAIPAMLTRTMAGMMQTMMSQMRASGCNPETM